MAENYDVIVLGAGIMGTAAAYHLSRDGQRVLVLEQFTIDHRLGSSYGESRIIRYAYNNRIYIELAKATFPMWREFEHELGQQVMFRTGGLDFGPATSPTLNATHQAMTAANIPFEWLSSADAEQRYSQFRL